MLDKLLSMASRHHSASDSRHEEPAATQGRRVARRRVAAEQKADTPSLDAASVANRIHEAENHEQIEKNILNRSSRLAKVLLAFHFAHECGYDEITSGDVEKITDELRIKIEQSSASHCISDNRKLFSAGAARRKGAKVPYKLNRLGSEVLKKAIETGKA